MVRNSMYLSPRQKATRRRILELSHVLRLAHIGSCFTAVDIIDAIYEIKKKGEKFILSNGHAGIALYVILEKRGMITNKRVLKKLHVHPDRNPQLDIHASTGSLGHGLPIALGMALADRKRTLYCMISDGECAEGSIWETLRIIADYQVHNLKIIVNANGWGGYDPIDLSTFAKRFQAFNFLVKKVDGHDITALKTILKTPGVDQPALVLAKTHVEQLPFLKGLDAHYYIMKDEDYELAMELLK